jgi:endonuclease/exonuclease/phosphatase family metal-dependent hydrolase
MGMMFLPHRGNPDRTRPLAPRVVSITCEGPPPPDGIHKLFGPHTFEDVSLAVGPPFPSNVQFMRRSTILSWLALTLLIGCDAKPTPNAAATGANPPVPAQKPGAPAQRPAQGPAQRPAQRTDTIRVGTWNLEHFGQRDKFQDRKDAPKNRTPEQIKAVAKFIADMAVDVLAVQEIGGPEPLRALLGHLGGAYRFALGTTGIYGETRISVGFLWNRERVELVQCEEMTEFPRKIGELAVFHRKPVNAVFRVVGGGMDFRAIVVHFKASRGKKNEAKRTAEVTYLRKYIATLQAKDGEDQDILVLGDFNHTYDAPAHKAFVADDLVRYAKAAAPSKIPTPTIVWFDEPIDQIALTKGVRDEVVKGSYRIHNQKGHYSAAAKGKITPIELEWRVNYSDHYPVTIDLSARVDGDPGATFTKPGHSLPTVGAK